MFWVEFLEGNAGDLLLRIHYCADISIAEVQNITFLVLQEGFENQN